VGQVLSHSNPGSFTDTGGTECVPEGVGPDGMPERWDEYAVLACRWCGRRAHGRIDRFTDERGRAEEWTGTPSPGEALAFSVMAS